MIARSHTERVVVGILASLAVLCLAPPALAHELRPAYLQMREDSAGEFNVLWKTPTRGELRLSLAPEFSAGTQALTPAATRLNGDAAVQTWRLRALEPLRGQTLRISGLEHTLTDVLARIEFLDGSTWVGRLTSQSPVIAIPARGSAWQVAGVYLALGVEHILLGIDHLLFVLALLLITRGAWRIVKVLTAFTVAHSITLGLATLGVVRVPSAPVEAVIALSIVFVAAEVVRARRGHEGVAARAPWVVALSFGLLHGFGFAGALTSAGLPEGHVPLALLFFNVGVECGQLLFVGAVLAGAALVRRMRVALPGWAELVPPYAIGATAMFWVIQRINAF